MNDIVLVDHLMIKLLLLQGEFYLFSISEQIPSIVSVGVLVDVDDSIKAAGAMIIELLPGHNEDDIEYLENGAIPTITDLIEHVIVLVKYRGLVVFPRLVFIISLTGIDSGTRRELQNIHHTCFVEQ